MGLQTSHSLLLSALSSGKESTFLGGSGQDSRQACPPTRDQALTTLPVSKAKSSLRTGNHGSRSGISTVNFPRVKGSFQQESSEALAHSTVPVPGGGAEGKDRNWPPGGSGPSRLWRVRAGGAYRS